MTEEMESILCELISAAGAARSSYIGAIQAAKTGQGDPAALMAEGDKYFEQAHDFHHNLLTKEGEGESQPVTLFAVHVEDQMMCAETFRILAQEFIDLYQSRDKKSRSKNHLPTCPNGRWANG